MRVLANRITDRTAELEALFLSSTMLQEGNFMITLYVLKRLQEETCHHLRSRMIRLLAAHFIASQQTTMTLVCGAIEQQIRSDRGWYDEIKNEEEDDDEEDDEEEESEEGAGDEADDGNTANNNADVTSVLDDGGSIDDGLLDDVSNRTYDFEDGDSINDSHCLKLYQHLQ